MSKVVHVCPTCGFPIPPDAAAARLVGKQLALYEIVKAAGSRGISSQQIMSALYANDPSGGPESPNIVSVMVRIINLHLEHFGVQIKGRSGPGGFYRLETLPTMTTNDNSDDAVYRRYHLGYSRDD